MGECGPTLSPLCSLPGVVGGTDGEEWHGQREGEGWEGMRLPAVTAACEHLMCSVLSGSLASCSLVCS